MAAQRAPKVVLFDIGGVCVLSPFQGIIDFETKHGIPTDWINYSIRYSSPSGYWQRLERGEIKLDADFFKGFTADLHNRSAWKEFHTTFRNERKKLKNVANPTQLGDHVSLNAEAADSKPTDQDRGVQLSHSSSKPPSAAKNNEGPSLSKLVEDTTIGDPVRLKSEVIEEPSLNRSKLKPISPPAAKEPIVAPSDSDFTLPPLPKIDGESLFWVMMAASSKTDPYIFPALQTLSKRSSRPILAALSNIVVYPPEHSYNKHNRSSTDNADSFNPREFFDVYIASAEVGMRKPARDIYETTIKRLNEFDRLKGGSGIRPEDIVFLDDIGENLKTGRSVGMRTIKVQLGKTWRAVKELEGVLGVDLMDEETRRAKL